MMRLHIEEFVAAGVRRGRCCCGIYPLVVWAIGQTVFPFQANGSMRHRARRQAGRLAADRAAVHQGRVLPAAALGGVV